MKRFLPLITLISSVLIFSCSEPEQKIPGYSENDNHLYYKLHTIGDGKRAPKPGEWLLLDAVYKTQKDSVFWDSRHNSSVPYYIVYKDRCQMGCFNEHFPKMVEGDSLSFIIRKEAFYKEIFETGIPIFSERDSVVKAEIKLLKILDAASYGKYLEEYRKKKEIAEQNEYSAMDKYATEHFSSQQQYKNGMYMEYIKRTGLDSIKKGKRVSFSYKGYYLDGRLVDYSPEGRPLEIIFGERDQILPGLQYGISLMCKGESAKFILPSHLAFGAQGSSNGSVAPYSPLVYEVEIVNVK